MKKFLKYFVIFFVFQFILYYYFLIDAELGINFIIGLSAFLLSIAFAYIIYDATKKIEEMDKRQKYISDTIQSYTDLIENDANVKFDQKMVDDFYDFLSVYKIDIKDPRVQIINNHILRNFKDK